MEEFNLDDMLGGADAFLNEQKQAVESNAAQSAKEDESKVLKFAAFLQLPRDIVIKIITNYLKANGEVNVEFLSGKISTLSAGMNLPREVNDLDIKWCADVIWAGWNSGRICPDVKSFNRLVCFSGQAECVPVQCGDKYVIAVTKFRYGSTPIIPGDIYHPICNTMFKMGSLGLEARPIPANLVGVLQSKKLFWPASVAPQLIAMGHKVIKKVPTPQSLGYLIGPQIASIRNKCGDLDAAVGHSIKPVTGSSIFAGKVLSQWSSFFEGFSHDSCGIVTVSRAIVALGFDGYYGMLNDVALWSTKSLVLKVRDKYESVVEHEYIEYRSVSKWPESFAVYNPTPAELNAALFAGVSAVKALIIPLTNVLSSAPQVKSYAKHHDKVLISVLCCSPPVMVIQPMADKGLNGATLKKHLALIEKAFVVGFLKVFDSYVRYTGPDSILSNSFDIVPADDYSDSVCSVEVRPRAVHFGLASNRYVSVSDSELTKLVPTLRVADVKIGGVTVSSEADSTLIAQYPRTNVASLLTRDDFISKRDIFYSSGNRCADVKFNIEEHLHKTEAVAESVSSEHVGSVININLGDVDTDDEMAA